MAHAAAFFAMAFQAVSLAYVLAGRGRKTPKPLFAVTCARLRSARRRSWCVLAQKAVLQALATKSARSLSVFEYERPLVLKWGLRRAPPQQLSAMSYIDWRGQARGEGPAKGPGAGAI